MHTENAPTGIFSNSIVNHDECAQGQPPPGSGSTNDESGFDACAFLLARVDFKWLMAGQGWWIDPHRFQYDPSYADEVLRLALASQSLPLRKCAASIQTQLGNSPSH